VSNTSASQVLATVLLCAFLRDTSSLRRRTSTAPLPRWRRVTVSPPYPSK
jgi:hypothetical protein